MTQDTQIATLFVVASSLFILFINQIIFSIKWRKLYLATAERNKQLLDIGDNAQNLAKNYLDAAKLITIHRNGRLNVFTFARGKEYFTIETMGLLSDTPQTWREQAGI